MKKSMIVYSALLALLTAACSGGSGVMSPPVPVNAPSVTEAARSTPDAPVVAAQDTFRDDRAEYVHTEFDGHDVRVHVGAYDNDWWYGSTLSSVLDTVQDYPVPPRLLGYSQHTWTLFKNGLTAVVGVRWNDNDRFDYLAGGWWMRENVGSAGYEVGAFIDGPELRGELPWSMSLPLRGHGTYHGGAVGFYETDLISCTTAGSCSKDVGEFMAEATLEADFAKGEIQGCVGCQDGIQMTPINHDVGTGEITRGDTFTIDRAFHLSTDEPASFLATPNTLGTFSGSLDVRTRSAVAVIPGLDPPDDYGHGSWQGRFSNVLDTEGKPRLVGGTLQGTLLDQGRMGVRPEDPTPAITGDRFFTGVLSAESTAFNPSAALDEAERAQWDAARQAAETDRNLAGPWVPWAFGSAPWTDLSDNPMLSGTATWSGRLRGFTPTLESVGGAAELAVELETLDGQLDFTGLEFWEANTTPGPVGTGTVWGDGDLRYLLNVRGNTFVQTGGDPGTVTGAFFGARHEAMGGVLKRTDLTADFGGAR